jgi:catechol 2,3-dioxygenase-like lactoylglutathione lyase family enzyme
MPAKVAHVVLAVRDPQASAAFYTEVLGMQRVWDFDKLDMVFFSFGERDHDIALIKAPEDAPLGNQGFSHVAFEVEGGEEELRHLYRRLLDYGSDVELKADHGLSKSIYFLDPDGNRLEFFYPTMASDAAMDFMRAGRAGLDPYDIEPASTPAS